VILRIGGYSVKAVWLERQGGWSLEMPGRKIIFSRSGISSACGKGKLKAAIKKSPIRIVETFAQNILAAQEQAAEDWIDLNWRLPISIGNLSCEVADLEESARKEYALGIVAAATG